MRINFVTNKLHRTIGFCIAAIASVVFLLCLSLLPSTAAQHTQTQTQAHNQTQVAAVESALATEVSPADRPVRTLVTEVFDQLEGVFAFTAQAIDAVRRPASSVTDGSLVLPATQTVGAQNPLARLPAGAPESGTLIINAPLSVTESLTVTGSSQLATTSVSGPFTAGQITGTSLSVGDAVVAGTLQVNGLGTMEQLNVTNGIDVGGSLAALGGITTNGADITLGSGSLFASNVVNEIVAGDNVIITGSRNAPIVSFEPEPFDGVLEINGERGRVEFEAGEDIEINGLEIENISDLESVTDRGGCSGCILDGDVSNILTLSGGSINNTSIGLSTAAAAAFSNVSVGTALATTSAFSVLSSGTSTFGGTINIESGCYAIDGVCVGGLSTPTYLGLSDTPSAYLSSALPFTNASGTALTQSLNLVFADDNLGIGTSTPLARLTVDGDTQLFGALTVIGGTSTQLSGGLNVTNGCVAVDGTCLGGAAQLGDLNDVTLATVTEGDILIYDGTTWANVASSTLGFGDGSFLGLDDTPEAYLPGSVLFSNATSGALVQSDQFVFDGARLAVGTDSPVTTLTVAGDLSLLDSALMRWYDADSSNYVGFRAPAAIGVNTQWVLPNSDGGIDEILVTDGAGNLRFDSVESVGGGARNFLGLDDTPASYITGAVPFTGTSSLLFSNQFVFDGQNLGIGQTLPTVPLNVKGNALLQAVNDAVGLYYNANADTVGIGTLNATARLAVENGSILQQGGRASSTYTPTAVDSLDLVSDPSANQVQVVGNRAYIVSSAAGDDFHIVDISNPADLVTIGELDLPATANDVFVVGNYAYAVTVVGGDDFHVIDISNERLPVEVGSVDLPTSANGVFVQGRYAYVVTDNIDEDFHVIDISDPVAPRVVGEIELSDSGTAVKVRGQYAYVTTRGTDEDFHVIDISSSTAPFVTDSVFLTDAANDVYVKDTYAYVVSNSTGNDFHVVDISNPTALMEVGGIDLVTSANAVTVAGKYAYVASAVTGDDLHVIDITNPIAPVIVGGLDLAAGAGTGVAVMGRYAYLTTTNTGREFFAVDLTGIEAQSGVMHALQSGSMTVLGDTVLSGRLDVGEGLLIGQAGIVSEGAVFATGAADSYFLGAISIGTTSASSELTVDGVIQATNLVSGGTTNLMADAQGNLILEASDERLKENVNTLTGSLAKLLELRGVSYAWKDKERFGDQLEIGFLAQEVDEVVPEVVRKGGAYWSLNTKNLLAVVVEAMKEMWTTVNGNQERIQVLEARIEQLESSSSQSVVDQSAQSAATESTSTGQAASATTTQGGVDDVTGSAESADVTAEVVSTTATGTSATTSSPTSLVEKDDLLEARMASSSDQVTSVPVTASSSLSSDGSAHVSTTTIISASDVAAEGPAKQPVDKELETEVVVEPEVAAAPLATPAVLDTEAVIAPPISE